MHLKKFYQWRIISSTSEKGLPELDNISTFHQIKALYRNNAADVSIGDTEATQIVGANGRASSMPTSAQHKNTTS